jgi:hypothetical protein
VVTLRGEHPRDVAGSTSDVEYLLDSDRHEGSQLICISLLGELQIFQ